MAEVLQPLQLKLGPETRDWGSKSGVLLASSLWLRNRSPERPSHFSHTQSQAVTGSLENVGLAGQPQTFIPRGLQSVLPLFRYKEDVALRAMAENELVVLKKATLPTWGGIRSWMLEV